MKIWGAAGVAVEVLMLMKFRPVLLRKNQYGRIHVWYGDAYAKLLLILLCQICISDMHTACAKLYSCSIVYADGNLRCWYKIPVPAGPCCWSEIYLHVRLYEEALILNIMLNTELTEMVLLLKLLLWKSQCGWNSVHGWYGGWRVQC